MYWTTDPGIYHALRVKRYQRFVLATLQGWTLFSIPLPVTPPEWKPFSKSFFGIVGRGILLAAGRYMGVSGGV